MSKVIVISHTDELTLPEQSKNQKRNSRGLSTSDYRRLLSQLSLRPPTQRAFLRRLLTRAIATGASKGLRVTTHVVVPVEPA